jgi:hypothetical protein
MLPARVTGEVGAFQRSRKDEIGSTRSASRFMGGHLRFKRDWGLATLYCSRQASLLIEV